MILWILLSAHMLADFSLQSAEWAEKKTEDLRYLIGHGAIYAVVLAISLGACLPWNVAWMPLTIITVSHLLIDWIRICIDRKYNYGTVQFASFIVDQILHILIIGLLVYLFALNEQNREWMLHLASAISLERILRYVLIFIIILDPAAVFVKKLSAYVSGNDEDRKQELPVGRIIGKLERIITVILVICNEVGAIGFVLTAKSLARYKQLDEQGFAEKYLVGTLSSTAIAIITALLLK